MTDQQNAIELVGLTKDFPLVERGRYLRAVDSVTLSIRKNSVFGLLGPNGSGKSTTIKMLLGLSQPSIGSISVFGKSPLDRSVRARIGYLPDAPYYHKFLSGLELMRFFGKLLGVEKSTREARSNELLDEFGLADAKDRKLGLYSKGMLQRLGFAQALIADPDLLILDEPTAGVDPVGADEVGEFVLELKKKGKTVLLCSHLLTQVQDLCDDIGVLNKGRLLASGTIEEMLELKEEGSLSLNGLDAETSLEIQSLVAKRGGSASRGSRELEDLFRSLVARDESEELR